MASSDARVSNYGQFHARKTRVALASYYGLVTFVDDLIGKILQVVDQKNLHDNTQIYYLSDHGDNIGERDFGENQIFTRICWSAMHHQGPGHTGRKSLYNPSFINRHPSNDTSNSRYRLRDEARCITH